MSVLLCTLVSKDIPTYLFAFSHIILFTARFQERKKQNHVFDKARNDSSDS